MGFFPAGAAHAVPPLVRMGPLRREGLNRQLTLAFGFMSCIPILITVWVMIYDVDLGFAIYPIVASQFIGYFFITRRMIRSVLQVNEQAQQAASKLIPEDLPAPAGRHEENEIGELARAFNRITQELEFKISALESSRELVKRLLCRIGTTIISYEGIDSILNLILEHTAIALDARCGSLLLLSPKTQELTVKSSWSADGQAPAGGYHVPLGSEMVGWVAKEGHPMRGTGSPATLGFAGQEQGAIACVPLKLRDRTIGVMGVMRESAARPFDEDDEALLSSIGSQMAVAIENSRLSRDVERTYLETILALALAVEAKDPYSAGHSKRVGFYAAKIGERLGLDAEMQRVLNDAGVLHDIGKIGIKDEILLKPIPLTADEDRMMRQHPLIGEAIVKPVRSLENVVALVRHHHERFDGSGYPDHLKGEAIPLGARILSVADTYDAMITDRPYRDRLPVEVAKAELRRQAGLQHDPAVVEAFLRFLDEKSPHLATEPTRRPPV